VQRQPERVRKYFEHEPVRYAALFKFDNAGSIAYTAIISFKAHQETEWVNPMGNAA
jgi:hypothetical protein